MDVFAQNLRTRAEALGLSNAEVADRCGLDARRYGHYVTGRNEPDLATLVKIANVLRTTPNELLGVREAGQSATVAKLIVACGYLDEAQNQMLLNFAEASVRMARSADPVTGS